MVVANVLSESRGQLTSSDLAAWGMVERLTVINQHLMNVPQEHGCGRILWNDLNSRQWT
jgi:hypothetical protein